jgi:hypothetical protein
MCFKVSFARRWNVGAVLSHLGVVIEIERDLRAEASGRAGRGRGKHFFRGNFQKERELFLQ